MARYTSHIISSNTKVSKALIKLNNLDLDNVLFIVDKSGKLIGSVTDGDIRRGFINGATTSSSMDG